MKNSIERARNYLAAFPILISQPGLLVWAVLLGFAGAFTTILFTNGVFLVQLFHTGTYGDPMAIATQWDTLKRLLIPTLGGLVGGCLLYWAGKIQMDTNSDYMEAVAIGDGRLSMRQGLLRVLSSMSVVATGASLGREGSIIHLAAMNGSFLGRFFKLDSHRLRLLVACGAAAGVSAAYHAPIAGAIFVAEIVLGSMAVNVLGPLMLSSTTAYITMQSLGYRSWLYEVPDITLIGHWYWIVVITLGLASGFLAPLFLSFLDLCRRNFVRLHLPLIARMTLAGFLLGVMFLYDPRVAGKGDMLVHSFLTSEWSLVAVLMMIALKLVSTGLSVGSGAVGGIITPVMFMGAGLAMIFVKTIGLVAPDIIHFIPLFILVGMGTFLAATSSAPMMAVILILEMTHRFSLVPALMIACVLAYFVARRCAGDVMFQVTESRDKSEHLRHQMSRMNIMALINPSTTTLTLENTVNDAVTLFTEQGLLYVYVIDAENHFQGAIAHKDITSMLLLQQDLHSPISKDLIQRTYLEPLRSNMSLDEVQDKFVNFPSERLPVVDLQDPPHLLGVVYKSDVLRKYREIKQLFEHSGQHVVSLRGHSSTRK